MRVDNAAKFVQNVLVVTAGILNGKYICISYQINVNLSQKHLGYLQIILPQSKFERSIGQSPAPRLHFKTCKSHFKKSSIS